MVSSVRPTVVDEPSIHVHVVAGHALSVKPPPECAAAIGSIRVIDFANSADGFVHAFHDIAGHPV
jgi:hypothetical protein